MKWRICDICLSLCALVYLFFSVMYIGLLLSSIAEKGKDFFLLASMVAISGSWLFMPVFMSAALAWFAGLLKPDHPTVQKVEDTLGLRKDDLDAFMRVGIPTKNLNKWATAQMDTPPDRTKASDYARVGES